MERALDIEVLSDAIGNHAALPDASELQRLIADLEVALVIREPQIPPDVLRAAWYLHGVASSDGAYQLYSPVRQRRAFTVSAHIFDLAVSNPDLPRTTQLEYGFASAIGYMRGRLEPNATAMYRRLQHLLLSDEPIERHTNTLALEAGLALVGLQTRELFSLFRAWRLSLAGLASRVGLDNLGGTGFGTAEAVVLGAEDLLFYLAFGTATRLTGARQRLVAATRGEAGPEDVDGRWVASHLLSLTDEVSAGSMWTILPPTIPNVVKQAFCFASPPILTLWEPQRELVSGSPSPFDESTRRLILSVPTSAGKTLVGQLLMVSHLAMSNSSVCYVAPTRSLGREVRRAIAGRLRIIQKEVGAEQPDFALTGDLLEALSRAIARILGDPTGVGDPPDVDVMTPERLAHLLREDPTQVLARYGLFMFDEAQLIGEAGRGLTMESLLAFLHWRTVNTGHRIVLLSAAMGNAGQLMTWLTADAGHRLQTSEWRGPRRLHAVFTTEPDWNRESRTASRSRDFPERITYPLNGQIRLRIASGLQSRRLVITQPVGQLTFKGTPDGRRGPRDAAMTTPVYKSAAQMVAALGHAGSVLVVTSTRDAARRMAEELARIVPASSEVTPLVDFARLRLGDAHPLVSTLRSGVAFHHAALPTDILESLEDGLRDDRIKYLTCTSTLTEGVNLPVRTVIIAETRYAGQPEDAQIRGARLVNALGRAGRAGRETEGWLVLVRADRPRPGDFELLNPSQAELEVRSQLATDSALAELAAFEEVLRQSEDAIFQATGRIADFVAYVWFVLAAEEQLEKTVEAADVRGALAATLGFQQLPVETQARWLSVAEATRAAYAQSDTGRRRAWAKSGTSIGTARTLDGLAEDLVEVIFSNTDRDPAPMSVEGCLDVLRAVSTLERLLQLPERPSDWSFRMTRSGLSAEVAVDIGDCLAAWLQGATLNSLAEQFLSDVPDESWRIEQLVDAVTAHFEHFLSWTISSLVELVNQRMEALETNLKLCPPFGVFIRNGVDTDEAVGLMLAGVRSRGLANRVVNQARQDGNLADIRAWLSTMSVNDWRVKFEATASEVLDLLDLTRTRRRSALRTLLQEGIAELALNPNAWREILLPAQPEGITSEAQSISVVVSEVGEDPSPRRLGVYLANNSLVDLVATSSYTDVHAIIDTGLPVATTVEGPAESPILRFRLAES